MAISVSCSRALWKSTGFKQQIGQYVDFLTVGYGLRQLRTPASKAVAATTTAVLRSGEETMRQVAKDELKALEGLTLDHRVRTTEKGAIITMQEFGDRPIFDFGKNSYLGLGCHPDVVKAAKDALDEFGAGNGTVRAATGNFAIHKRLENALTEFHERDTDLFDSVVFPTGYHANMALFQKLAGKGDVIISDAYIHGSAICGMTHSKAVKDVFKNNDMEDLEDKLRSHMDKRQRIIAADGVYSVDGTCAKMREMRDLADRYDAVLMIDDSHGVGIVGENGKGTEDYSGAMNSADIITGSLCKGLTPAGGYIMARTELTDLIRNRSWPYVLSTGMTPSNTAAVIQALRIADSEEGQERRQRMWRLSTKFRQTLTDAGFIVLGEAGIPITPVVFKNDGHYTRLFVMELGKEGIVAPAATIPWTPKETPRVRIVISAYHSEEQVDYCIQAFKTVAKRMGKTQ